ncbi:hypothetical protein F9288_16655 [Sphingomonas sp. CL5.1]|uniref:hypothetical protein n=1 Tax=Sphingomonas sp. CL5.1 TaxID=2653203 RepID=UPI00158283C0|nr:hypothetical protein [Sphingomonas sp. CL5.1]QKS01075.1 hypothetical protein F9288_16655 [Sphingomonas sp. CL5.1]
MTDWPQQGLMNAKLYIVTIRTIPELLRKRRPDKRSLSTEPPTALPRSMKMSGYQGRIWAIDHDSPEIS